MARAGSDKGPPDPAFESPECRRSFIGNSDIETQAARLVARGDLTNGWLLTGPAGIGKATFAFRIARALLSSKTVDTGFNVDETSATSGANDLNFNAYGSTKGADLIAAGAHPDLFVARTSWNEKTQKFAQDISVETIRQLTRSLGQTPSMGSWRVAIIDTADDMNRNAANALLKVLEEPPKRTTLLLLSTQPGRLLATIRSRCRRLSLKQVDEQAIKAFLENEGAATGDDAETIATASRGRPGFALSLAAADGVAAINAVDAFMKSVGRAGIPDAVINQLTGRGAEEAWRIFKDLLSERLTSRIIAVAEKGEAGISGCIDARDDSLELLGRGDALNLDRGPLLREVARRMRPMGPILTEFNRLK
ncbi:MAG: AAA family ATPase [Pseudomonadota bacterium]